MKLISCSMASKRHSTQRSEMCAGTIRPPDPHQYRHTSSRISRMYKPELFIDGVWRGCAGRETLDVLDPATEQVLAHLPIATRDDLDDALAAAERAFAIWSRLSS